MDRKKLAGLAARNHGVVTRSELTSAGVSSSAIDQRISSGEWHRVFRGVYILSPRDPSFWQKLIAVERWTDGTGVFSHHTAAYLHGMLTAPPKVPEIVVGATSGLTSTPLVRVHRTRIPFDAQQEPRRTSIARTAVDLITSASSERHVMDVLISAVQNGMSPAEFGSEIDARARMRHRIFARRLIDTTEEGVESHLELEYQRRVESAHGLPRAIRQKWELIRGRWIRSDCLYEGFSVRAELDGELAHPGRATHDDLVRDNDVLLLRDEITLRFRWTHVMHDPCLAAGQVAAALRRHGWSGELRLCSPECTAQRTSAALEPGIAS